uniref:Uncharacterized protein n=1 Tax=Trypanosoma congolense (strain IL3000) TaxID=1068625 RepID=G0UV19_TRYCI|nr:conserved hypothetical protein [Trypanosoma congolense IL3000]
MAVRCPIRRCFPWGVSIPSAFRQKAKVIPLEAALTRGQPHAIVVSFLLYAHTSSIQHIFPVRNAEKLTHDNPNAAGSCLQRVLSCQVSRDLIMCACVVAATPTWLLPAPVQRRAVTVREGKDAALASPSWRAFLFALLSSVYNQTKLQSPSALAPLCAICLSPSLQVGHQLARAHILNGGGGAVGGGKEKEIHVADSVAAFAACCVACEVDIEKRDAAWMQLWDDVEPLLQPHRNGEAVALSTSWVLCQEMLIGCLMRAGRYDDVQAELSQGHITIEQLHRMSDSTLALLIGHPSMCNAVRLHVVRALVHVRRTQGGTAGALQLSPFARSSRLPSATRSAHMLATALRCLLVQASADPSPSNSARLFSDIGVLCHTCDSYVLARSLLPSVSDSSGRDEAIAFHMKATRDEHRAKLLAELVVVIADCVAFARNYWRRGDNSSADVVHACAALLSGLLSLCSPYRVRYRVEDSGGNSKMRAQPAWRRRLQRNEAVRSHKYELLPVELPHEALSRCVALLLADGFVLAGGGLGATLAVADFVDLNHYPLQLLGSLYHATRAVEKDERLAEALIILESLYRRRRQVFGEDGNISLPRRTPAPGLPAGGGRSANTGLTCTVTAHSSLLTAKGEMPRGVGELSLNILRSRSTIVAGGAFAVDHRVGVWLRKATVRVEA